MLKSTTKTPFTLFVYPGLAVVLMLVASAPAMASDMPFSSDNTIDGSFDGASSVVSVDIDGDGDLDVAATSRWTGIVSWWENPSWTERVIATGFAEAYHLAVGDINGDGRPDLVGAARTEAGSNVRWWQNPGPGVGAPWAWANVSGSFLGQALAVATGDIDGDGYVDIAAAGHHSSVGGVYAWFRNRNGDGTFFDAYDIGTGYGTPHSVDLVDINHDDHLDLIGANYSGDTVVWFENDGTYLPVDPWAASIVGTAIDGAICVRGADIDRDGDLDVAVAAYDQGRLLWYESNGSDPPTWSQHLVETSFAGTYSVEPVDLDRDGDLDLLASARVDDAVRWWEHVGTSWYERSIDDVFDGARSAIAADLDGDGDMDVIAAADAADDVTWWENRSVHRDTRFWTPTAVSNNSGEYWGVETFDANRDGKLDIVAVASNESDYGDVMLFLQGGTTGSWSTVELADNISGATTIRVADLNYDTNPDLLVAAGGEDTIAWFEGNGAGLFSRRDVATGFNGAADATVADINGDGNLDVVGAAETAGLLRWWENNLGGAPPWTEHMFAPLPGATAVATGDLDGDLDPDVVAVSASLGELTWYENLGDSGGTWMWTPRTLTTALNQPRTVVVADISGDGRNDIVAAGMSGTTDLMRWVNLGGSPPTWSLATISGPATAVGGVAQLRAVDLDLDGDLDLTGVFPIDGRAYAWMNTNGNGTSWVGNTIQNFNGSMMPLAITSADIDADGDPDPVVVGNNDVALVRNQGGQFDVWVDPEPAAQVGEGELKVLMSITPRHLGRSSDLALELEWLNLGFERENGTAMVESEINALVDRLYLFHDENGNGVLEVGVDPLLVVDATIDMVSPGYVQLAVPHSQVNPSIVSDGTESFFLVAEIEEGASSASPSCFRTEHKAGGTVTALSYELYDIDPKPALFFSVDGGLMCAVADLFSDGFESGNTSAWSVTQN